MSKGLFDTFSGIFQDISTFMIQVVLRFFDAVFAVIF